MRFFEEGETGFGDGGVTSYDRTMMDEFAIRQGDDVAITVDLDYLARTGLKRMVIVEPNALDIKNE